MFRRSVAVSLLFVLVMVLSALGGFGERASAAHKAEFSLSTGDSGLTVIVPSGVQTFTVPPTKVFIPLCAAVTNGGSTTTLRSLQATIAGRDFAVPTSAVIKPQPRSAAEILQLVSADSSAATQEALKDVFVTQLEFDVSGLGLKEGDSIPITIKVQGESLGKSIETLVTTVYSVLALPVRSGWYGGDGHVHTAWSPDCWGISIDNRTSYAQSNGFGWIAITDHENGINNNWPSYVGQCNTAQSSYGIPVCPGGEIAVATPDEHCLGYALSESAPNIPDNKAFSSADLTLQIWNHNPGYSYTTVAHPYQAYPWTTWDKATMQYVRAMELLTNQNTANPSTISKWFEQLRIGIGPVSSTNPWNTLATGQFLVGIGTSDCHNLRAPGENGFTWVYTMSYSGSNRAAIWQSIRAGRVSASGLKDLGCFAVDNQPQGSVLRLAAGTSITLKLVQQPVTGRKCTAITVYDKSQNPIRTISSPTNTETTWTTTSPSQDDFFVVKFDFANLDGSAPSEVWANPIFIDVP